jgi:peptidoglycan/LPS O-acetylase OafA/YrhL
VTPSVVRYAGYLVGVEGVLAVVSAVVLVVRALAGADQHVVNGYGTAAWFVIIGAAVLAAGWALITGRRWGRGIAVFANLLLLGVAYYVYGSHQLVYAVLIAVIALVTLGLLFSPAAVQWASSGRDTGHPDANDVSSGPDTR